MGCLCIDQLSNLIVLNSNLYLLEIDGRELTIVSKNTRKNSIVIPVSVL